VRTVKAPRHGNKHAETEFDQLVATGQPAAIVPIPHPPVKPAEIKRLLTNNRRVEWTPRAVARIFHGIASPKFEANEWVRSPFWASQPLTSFKELMKFCQRTTCDPAKIPDA
jgi:hypothetical protein